MRRRIFIVSAKDLKAADFTGKSDPFVVVLHRGKQVFKTRVKKNTLCPTWNEDFEFTFDANERSPLILRCYDWDRFSSDDFLGETKIDVMALMKEGSHEFDLGEGENEEGKKKSYFKYVGGKLKILVVR